MLDIETIAAFAVGFGLGVVVIALLIPVFSSRSRAGVRAELEDRDRYIADLRQEQAEDRETNRRLRHELATAVPESLSTLRAERTAAMAEVERLRGELVDRDRSLREARLAIQEIRHALEHDDGARARPTGLTPSRIGDPELAPGHDGSRPEGDEAVAGPVETGGFAPPDGEAIREAVTGEGSVSGADAGPDEVIDVRQEPLEGDASPAGNEVRPGQPPLPIAPLDVAAPGPPAGGAGPGEPGPDGTSTVFFGDYPLNEPSTSS